MPNLAIQLFSLFLIFHLSAFFAYEALNDLTGSDPLFTSKPPSLFGTLKNAETPAHGQSPEEMKN